MNYENGAWSMLGGAGRGYLLESLGEDRCRTCGEELFDATGFFQVHETTCGWREFEHADDICGVAQLRLHRATVDLFRFIDD